MAKFFPSFDGPEVGAIPDYANRDNDILRNLEWQPEDMAKFFPSLDGPEVGAGASPDLSRIGQTPQPKLQNPEQLSAAQEPQKASDPLLSVDEAYRKYTLDEFVFWSYLPQKFEHLNSQIDGWNLATIIADDSPMRGVITELDKIDEKRLKVAEFSRHDRASAKWENRQQSISASLDKTWQKLEPFFKAIDLDKARQHLEEYLRTKLIDIAGWDLDGEKPQKLMELLTELHKELLDVDEMILQFPRSQQKPLKKMRLAVDEKLKPLAPEIKPLVQKTIASAKNELASVENAIEAREKRGHDRKAAGGLTNAQHEIEDDLKRLRAAKTAHEVAQIVHDVDEDVEQAEKIFHGWEGKLHQHQGESEEHFKKRTDKWINPEQDDDELEADLRKKHAENSVLLPKWWVNWKLDRQFEYDKTLARPKLYRVLRIFFKILVMGALTLNPKFQFWQILDICSI